MSKIDFYIQTIAQLQSEGQPLFDAGLFAAYRSNDSIGYKRADTTLFFTAITVFTMQKIKHLLSDDNQKIIDAIAQKAMESYPKFQNKDGLKTYNFWKTKPSQHFPNGFIFRHFDHFRIADDADDTCMAYLTSTISADQSLWLKNKLALHANGHRQKIKNTYPEYRNLQAYSTWFGQNMYIEFDACVLSNVLYFVFENKLPLNQHDTDSLAYIKSIVETNRYKNEPFRVAHQYPRTVLIMYHIARLIGTFDPLALQSIRPQLVADIQAELSIVTHFFDKILLETSLMRLGVFDNNGICFEQKTAFDDMNKKEKDFYFFIAGLLTAYENPLLYRMARWPIFHIKWQCEAHNLALLAEHEALLSNFLHLCNKK
jgi:hypothetical protein